jgi:crotonobetainyl-CoA:carnitine CoA-transferase CaiB-like acyl-CoA transferase
VGADEEQGDLPLARLRVVDTTDRTALSAARLLADLGAEVIRVERSAGELDALTASRNANKRSVVLERPEDLRALLAHADVWFDTGGSGLDPGAVHAEIPDLVVVSLSPFGTTGPYRDLAATHPVVYALSGQLKACRSGDREPLLPPGQPAFEVAAAMAAYLALVTLWNRALIGVGDHIELSVHEAFIQTTDTAIPNASVRMGEAPGVVRAGHPAFPTRDGLVRPVVVSARQWKALRDWVGNPAYLDDPELASYGGRLLHGDVLAKLYGPLFADTETEAVCEEAQRRNVPVTPVMSPAQLLTSGPMAERGSFAETTVGARSGTLPAGYWEFDDTRVGFREPAPEIGADTADVVAALARGESPFAAPGFTMVPRAGSREPPLSGLRVLEFTQLMAGPEAGRLLRDHGADVIRVESRAFPDQSRVFGGPANMSAQFVTINRDKRSFGIDLTRPEGLALVLELVSRADVVIENLGPGAMENMGLGRDALRSANPDLVVVSSQLFGDNGPWGWWRGFGTHARSVGGQTWLWRYPGSEAEFAENTIFFPDQFAARLEALAAVACVGAAIPHHIRVSQADAVLNSLSELVLQESLEPGSVDAVGNRSPLGCPWGVYRCAGEDDWCVITARDDRDWAALVDAIGNPPWARDERFVTAAGRFSRADELDAHLGAWTATLPARRVMETLQGAGVPAAAVLAAADLLEDPHLQARGFVELILQPGFDAVFVEGDCYAAERLPTKPPGPAPLQGQHTREIASELLGLDAEQVQHLVDEAVLEPAADETSAS